MKKGDLCFFYHSNIGKEIVGVIKVVKEAFVDKTDMFSTCFSQRRLLQSWTLHFLWTGTVLEAHPEKNTISVCAQA